MFNFDEFFREFFQSKRICDKIILCATRYCNKNCPIKIVLWVWKISLWTNGVCIQVIPNRFAVTDAIRLFVEPPLVPSLTGTPNPCRGNRHVYVNPVARILIDRYPSLRFCGLLYTYITVVLLMVSTRKCPYMMRKEEPYSVNPKNVKFIKTIQLMFWFHLCRFLVSLCVIFWCFVCLASCVARAFWGVLALLQDFSPSLLMHLDAHIFSLS